MKMPKRFVEPSQGRLLLSEPALSDNYFSRSVVLLVEHSETEGSVGLILNKPINMKLNEVAKDFPSIDFPIYLGGPVHPDRLFYLHTKGELVSGSIKVFNDLFWGGDITKVVELIENKQLNKSQVRFFIGYSGWSVGQLDNELAEKSWIVSMTNKKSIMGPNPEKLWSELIKQMGSDYAIWANFPADPILN